jgi:hypothetical protein
MAALQAIQDPEQKKDGHKSLILELLFSISPIKGGAVLFYLTKKSEGREWEQTKGDRQEERERESSKKRRRMCRERERGRGRQRVTNETGRPTADKKMIAVGNIHKEREREREEKKMIAVGFEPTPSRTRA